MPSSAPSGNFRQKTFVAQSNAKFIEIRDQIITLADSLCASQRQEPCLFRMTRTRLSSEVLNEQKQTQGRLGNSRVQGLLLPFPDEASLP